MSNRFFQVFAIRPFLFLWLAEIFSQVAMNMVNFTLLLVAYKLSGSNTAVSGIVLSFTIPAILFGMIAGVFVDRWEKKKVLFATNAIRTLLLVVLAVLNFNLFFIYVLSFIIAIVTQFFIPAETPMIPRLVPKELLMTANALFGVGIYGSVVIAYALSGPFLIFFGDTYVFIAIAFMFFLAAFLVSQIGEPKQKAYVVREKAENMKITIAQEVRTAIALMMKTRAISHSLILLTLSQVIILILAVLGPGFASQILNIQIDAFPLLFVTPAALGMVMSGFILVHFFHAFSKEKSATVGVFVSGIALFLLPSAAMVASKGLIPAINGFLPASLSISMFHVVILIAFILGAANALVFVPSNTILQEATSDEFRGKAYGALNALIGIFSLFPIIVVGSLADTFGVGRVLTGIGIAIIMVGVLRVFAAMRGL